MFSALRLIRAGGVLAALALLGAPASAQTASAVLAGRVRTVDGGPVADAVVQARAEATGAARATLTDTQGRYRLDGVQPGVWIVVARLSDGAISASRSVDLHLQQTTVVDFTVGTGVSEHVTVRAEQPLVDRKELGGKLLIGGGKVDALPLAGRDLTGLALLDSSVRQAAPGNQFGERGSVFVVNGQSGRSNSFRVDGLDNNDTTSGTAPNSFFSQQVIQEFVLLTQQFAPEFGQASGGLLNIVTRQGSNERTWNGFVQGTATGWNAPGRFVESLPDSGRSQDAVQRYQAGVSVGGPIRQDRAFYFGAYEHQEMDDVLPFTGVDGNGVEGGRFIAPSRDDSFFVRADFNLDSANSLMLRLSADDRSSSGINVGGVWTPEAGFRIGEKDLQLAVTWTSVLSPSVLLETRLLAAGSRFDQMANSESPGATRPSGIFGGNVLSRQERDEDKVQIVQNVTWHRGPHTAKFGLDVTRSRTRIATRFNQRGNFLYNYDFPFEPGDCGEPTISDTLNHDPAGKFDCPGRANVDDDGDGQFDEQGNIFGYPLVFSRVLGEPRAELHDTRIALFAQDRAEIGRRWLLQYGLRYDLSTYELPAGARVDSPIPNGGAGRDTDNLAPRFGFTFTPKAGGKLVVRGGAGVFYDKLVLAFPAIAAITSGTEIGLMFPQGFAFEVTEKTREEIPLLFPPQLTMRFSTGTELQTPYTVQYNLGMEREIGSHSAFRANVTHSLGYRQPLLKDLNPVTGLVPGDQAVGVLQDPTVDCTAIGIVPDLDVGVPCHARDPFHGSIAAVVTEGRSWYTGLDLSWRTQFDDAWFSASYTLSRSEDLGFDPLKDGISLPPDSDNLAAERGRSDGDRRHRLVLSGEMGLPVAGLRASTVLQVSSGMPFNVTTGQDDNVDGLLNDRPSGVGRNAGERASIAAINAVRDQPVVPLAPITSLHEPSFFQIDLRVYRPFAFNGGRAKGSVYFQVFNLLDRENAGLIEGRAISPNFGQTIGLAGPPRTVELGLSMGY